MSSSVELRQCNHALPDRLETEAERVVRGDPQRELARKVGLPVLEPPRVGTHGIPVGGDPRRGVQIEERRLEPVEHRSPHIQEPGGARPPQELPARGRQDVAPDRVHVDRHLPDRLAGVQQIRDSRLARHVSHRRGGIDEPSVGRHVRERDQPHPAVDRPAEGVDGDLAVLVVRDGLDHSPRTRCHLQAI